MPSVQYCGSKLEVSKILAFDAHIQNWVTLHVQNKCKTDSGNSSHKEH